MKLLYRDGIGFEKWLSYVDRILIEKFGAPSDCLPDFCWADQFDDRKTPRDAIENYLEEFEN